MNKYGAIILPETMLKVGLVASDFGAPWGTAAIRLHEEGMLTIVDGVAKVNLQKVR